VPDRRSDLRFGRRLRFVEQQPRLLRPDGVDVPSEACLFAIELRGVKVDGCSRVDSIEMNVVEVRRRRSWSRGNLSRGTSKRNRLLLSASRAGGHPKVEHS
jgi:hypothetical protein